MLLTARSVVRRLPFTTTYAVLLAAGSLGVGQLADAQRLHVLRSVSTNLDNLTSGHIETLVVSAFVPAAVAAPVLLLAVVGIALCELVLAWRVTLLAFAIGHVAVSLVIAALLALRALPGVALDGVRDAVDTGPSYGAAAVIAAGLVVAVLRARPVLRGRLLALLVLPAAVPVAAVLLLAASPTFSAWGHLLALLTGAGIGVAAARSLRSPRGPVPAVAG